MKEEEKLAADVAATAASVADWKSRIAGLETQAGELNGVVTKAIASREGHALSALLGDSKAKFAIATARTAQQAAEEDLRDISHALPAARIQLVAAEKAATAARRALALVHARKMMHERVAAAAMIDVGNTMTAKGYADFERLGRELQNFPDLDIWHGGSLSHHENVTGYRRIAASLPPFFLKLFPGIWNSDPRRSLAESEAAFWQLPPEENADDKKAA
jgi:hypothetical protein